jgi:RecA/RadA recombinase
MAKTTKKSKPDGKPAAKKKAKPAVGKSVETNKAVPASEPSAGDKPSSRPSLAAFYASAAAEVDKTLHLSSGTAQWPDPVSSGCLMSDYVMGGGINACFSQLSGSEATGKSTLSLLAMASASKSDVPLVVFLDAEGSVSIDYAESMTGGSFDMAEAFSSERIRYYDGNIIEDVAAQLSGIIKKLPTKVWLPEDKTWAYAVPKGDKSFAAMLSAMEKAGMKPSKALSSGKSWVVPTDYTGIEAAIFVDSWASMIPRSMDETEGDLKGGMAINARTFAREIPRFSGMVRSKCVGLWSVNQLREKPGVMYGDPLVEPGGVTLKHASSMRARMFSRAVPQGLTRDPDAYALGIEPSATKAGGVDRYAYKQIINTKAKKGRPYLKGNMRVWVADADGKARGFCPVYDTMEFLKATGQLSGTTKKLVVAMSGPGSTKATVALAERTFTYGELKKLIVAEANADTDKKFVAETTKALKLDRLPGLRAACFAQLRKDPAIWNRGGKVAEEANESESGD